jgi:hypothetical protein
VANIVNAIATSNAPASKTKFFSQLILLLSVWLRAAANGKEKDLTASALPMNHGPVRLHPSRPLVAYEAL